MGSVGITHYNRLSCYLSTFNGEITCIKSEQSLESEIWPHNNRPTWLLWHRPPSRSSHAPQIRQRYICQNRVSSRMLCALMRSWDNWIESLGLPFYEYWSRFNSGSITSANRVIAFISLTRSMQIQTQILHRRARLVIVSRSGYETSRTWACYFFENSPYFLVLREYRWHHSAILDLFTWGILLESS